MNRSEIFNAIEAYLTNKINLLQQDITDLAADLAGDTKSSAGDKFETAREMSQQEISKLTQQVNEQKKWLSLTKSYATATNFVQVQAGCIVKTSIGNFVVGLPLGKIDELPTYYCIGNTAPLAQVLLNKQVNDSLQFNGKTIVIAAIS
jgi:transcription elongation GreA/GreB family factor